MKYKSFLSITDLSSRELWNLFDTASKLKKEIKKTGKNKEYLKNKVLAMIFEKPSLRTKVSFAIGMNQLGGHALYLGPTDICMGKRESVHDVAKVTSSMADIIMARTFLHETILELAKYSSKPVINGLSDLQHPCQILADFLTILEVKKKIVGIKIAYLGDSENNVAHSLALASGILGTHFITASPKGYWMNKVITKSAMTLAKKQGGSIQEVIDPNVAVQNADVVYTDTWVSMGDEAEKEKRLHVFQKYQVTELLMKKANKDAIFMHDLPAYRGNEVETKVIDGLQSVVFQQAENRLHVQKALMLYLLKINL
ncbi:ornithine carbamoyltransferase [Candidatus Roizmanbacteria bacterium]|nr:ornithine carbamoyltransferase [Candidatus Roizmanbacteria bacterium]